MGAKLGGCVGCLEGCTLGDNDGGEVVAFIIIAVGLGLVVGIIVINDLSAEEVSFSVIGATVGIIVAFVTVGS